MQNRPPKFATTLLEWFGPADPAVAGDLREASSQHSRLWYWRQVIGAICLWSLRDVTARPIVVGRAVALAWLVVWAGSRLVFSILGLPEWLFTTGLAPALYLHGYAGLPPWARTFPALAIWKMLVFAGGGWVGTRRAGQNGHTVLLAFVFLILCSNAVYFMEEVARPSGTIRLNS